MNPDSYISTEPAYTDIHIYDKPIGVNTVDESEVLADVDVPVVKHKHKHKHKYVGDSKMSEPVNIFANPLGGNMDGNSGFGMGGGLIGGLLLGTLLRNGGLGGAVAADAAVNACAAPIATATILTALGDIKASIPLSEAQTQLALAQAQDQLTNVTLQQTNALTQGQGNILIAQQAGLANIGQQLCGVNQNVAQSGWAVTTAVTNDGEKTRALINSIDRDNLSRQITILANEATELRNENSRQAATHGITIQNTMNQNQNQLQFQAQAQAINTLGGLLHTCDQNIRATNQAINIGSGLQVANPDNNNTNVRA